MLPSGVAVDASDDLYIADSGNSRVLEYNTPLSDGNVGEHDRRSGVRAGWQLYFNVQQRRTERQQPVPGRGVALDPSGNLYIADSVNNRVLEYKLRSYRTGAVEPPI